ncbi:hypothetical protein FEDK69T_19850 [Flavobacterium enshiense DK69]|uniref:Lipoprotein n=1 Tax=Flavobacterium enshiense DK69 TaxID=1107311 RepID=V6SEA4_9FLAO|nr:hypothetical protein [Flavobacterium enshiense]ESU22725.1 hypothetical protein FEDK69T_19850 [Flavobacterium enshiense DK69]KGO95579.1 hypothetical protein Q767_10130 [Flavobacterium enshiense DK69]
MSKKITLLLAFIGMIGLQSCVKEEYIVQDINDQDTISEVFEYYDVDFFPDNHNEYNVLLDFFHPIYTSDMVLVYRLAGVGVDGNEWKLLPETYYFPDGTVDYGYRNDFTQYNALVQLHGFDLGGLSNEFKLNQMFRVAIIPAFVNNKQTSKVDFKDYNAVVKAYNIDESKIQKIKM